jgi:hypothetical protein
MAEECAHVTCVREVEVTVEFEAGETVRGYCPRHYRELAEKDYFEMDVLEGL